MTSAKMGLSLAYWSDVHCNSSGGQFTTNCNIAAEKFRKATLSKKKYIYIQIQKKNKTYGQFY